MLALAFSSKSSCAKVQPQRAARVALDSCSLAVLAIPPIGSLCYGYVML